MGHNSSTFYEYFNVIIRKKQTHSDLTDFLHATCFSPVISTFLQAVKNNRFITWSGVTPILITKHITNKIATVKGLLNQERKNLRSTKPSPRQYKKIHQEHKNNIKHLQTALPNRTTITKPLQKKT